MAPPYFCSRDEFQMWKSGLHCQDDAADDAALDRNSRPMLWKVRVVMEMMQESCRRHYRPGLDIAYDS